MLWNLLKERVFTGKKDFACLVPIRAGSKSPTAKRNAGFLLVILFILWHKSDAKPLKLRAVLVSLYEWCSFTYPWWQCQWLLEHPQMQSMLHSTQGLMRFYKVFPLVYTQHSLISWTLVRVASQCHVVPLVNTSEIFAVCMVDLATLG